MMSGTFGAPAGGVGRRGKFFHREVAAGGVTVWFAAFCANAYGAIIARIPTDTVAHPGARALDMLPPSPARHCCGGETARHSRAEQRPGWLSAIFSIGYIFLRAAAW